MRCYKTRCTLHTRRASGRPAFVRPSLPRESAWNARARPSFLSPSAALLSTYARRNARLSDARITLLTYLLTQRPGRRKKEARRPCPSRLFTRLTTPRGSAMLGRPLPLLLLLLPLLAHGFRAHVRTAHRLARGESRQASVHAWVRLLLRGFRRLHFTEAAASQSTSQPSEDEDPSLRLGARILGGSFGGFAGNKLFSSLAKHRRLDRCWWLHCVHPRSTRRGARACSASSSCSSRLQKQAPAGRLPGERRAASVGLGARPASGTTRSRPQLPAAASTSSGSPPQLAVLTGPPLCSRRSCARCYGAIAFETLADEQGAAHPRTPCLGACGAASTPWCAGRARPPASPPRAPSRPSRTAVAEQLEKS